MSPCRRGGVWWFGMVWVWMMGVRVLCGVLRVLWGDCQFGHRWNTVKPLLLVVSKHAFTRKKTTGRYATTEQ